MSHESIVPFFHRNRSPSSLSRLKYYHRNVDDILLGYGLFSSSSVSNFTLDSSHSISILTSNGADVLKLEKPDGEDISYQEGMSYTFTSSQPVHIQFKFASSDPDTEDSNLRIMDNVHWH